ncbi:Cytochrome c [Gammaproteobacteria bacterium]
MQKKTILAKTVLFCLLATPLPLAVADSPAKKALEAREDLMKGMGDHMKALKKALGDGDSQNLAKHAKDMAALTHTLATDLKSLFPAGSGEGDTEAKPLIWKQWNDFDQAAQAAAAKGAALLEASSRAADVQSAFKALGETCKNCHKDYRAEK